MYQIMSGNYEKYNRNKPRCPKPASLDDEIEGNWELKNNIAPPTKPIEMTSPEALEKIKDERSRLFCL